jgi:Xaa-Pro aminopeptidase
MTVKKLQEIIKEKSYQAFLVTNLHNVFYLTNFWASSGAVLVTADISYFMTDARYILKAREEIQGFEIIETRDFLRQVKGILDEKNIHKLLFEEDVAYSFYKQMQLILVDIDLAAASNLVESLRMIKTPEEIEIIKQACSISDQAFTDVLNFITPGKTELEVANFLDFRMRELGASGVSFETIVASGKRSSMPHGVASDKKIEVGDPITLDFGCYYKHYASDMTRTIFLGQPTDEMIEVYNTVLMSNEALIGQAKSGIKLSDYDLIARQVIADAGYGDYFTHGIGHGLGIDVHEIPYFSKTSEGFLEADMVVTDEPGIYLDNHFGVRIEDDLLITDNSCEILTRSSKEIIIL